MTTDYSDVQIPIEIREAIDKVQKVPSSIRVKDVLENLVGDFDRVSVSFYLKAYKAQCRYVPPKQRLQDLLATAQELKHCVEDGKVSTYTDEASELLDEFSGQLDAYLEAKRQSILMRSSNKGDE